MSFLKYVKRNLSSILPVPGRLGTFVFSLLIIMDFKEPFTISIHHFEPLL